MTVTFEGGDQSSTRKDSRGLCCVCGDVHPEDSALLTRPIEITVKRDPYPLSQTTRSKLPVITFKRTFGTSLPLSASESSVLLWLRVTTNNVPSYYQCVILASNPHVIYDINSNPILWHIWAYCLSFFLFICIYSKTRLSRHFWDQNFCVDLEIWRPTHKSPFRRLMCMSPFRRLVCIYRHFGDLCTVHVWHSYP